MSVSKEELDSFTQVLYGKFGLDFTGYEPQSLTRRVNKVLHTLKFSSIHDLWSAILKNPDLIHVFMDEVSVGLTSMFRDPMMWSRMRSILYNEFKQRKSLRIWNAGCSTGEEVYTIAILLQELNILDNTTIVATDMNQSALATAKKGEYHKVKIIDYERHYREYNSFGTFSRYYEPVSDSNHLQMKRDLIKNVQFKYHNLITDPFKEKFDLIFCRNVMIYFDSEAKKRLMDRFRSCLTEGGFFITGFYDSMLTTDEKAYFYDDHSSSRIFKIRNDQISQSA